MNSKFVVFLFAVVLVLGGSSAEAMPPKREMPPKRIKKRIGITAPSNPYTLLMTVKSDEKSDNVSAIRANIPLVMEVLEREDWSSFQWVDMEIYKYLTDFFTPDRYLELVTENDCSVINTLSKDLVTKKMFTDIPLAQHFILRALAAVKINTSSDVVMSTNQKIPDKVHKLIKTYRLSEDQLPSFTEPEDSRDDFYKLLEKLRDKFATFKNTIDTHTLTNHLGVAFDHVDARRVFDDENDGWSIKIHSNDEEDDVTLKDFLNLFMAEGGVGQVMFYLLTSEEGVDDDDDFQPEHILKQKFVDFVNKTWPSFELPYKNNISLLFLQHLKVNPLSVSVAPSSASAMTPMPMDVSHGYMLSKPSTSSSSPSVDTTQILKIFKEQYYTTFVRVLPMTDTMFMVDLYSKKVITGQEKAVIEQDRKLVTRYDKAAHLLSEIIMPSLKVGFSEKFETLIECMEKSDNRLLIKVAGDWRRDIGQPGGGVVVVKRPKVISDAAAYESLRQSSVEMVTKLDLNNPVFVALLNTNGLFPLGTKETMESKSTPAGKASYFQSQIEHCGKSLGKFMDALEREGSTNHLELRAALISNLPK